MIEVSPLHRLEYGAPVVLQMEYAEDVQWNVEKGRALAVTVPIAPGQVVPLEVHRLGWPQKDCKTLELSHFCGSRLIVPL